MAKKALRESRKAFFVKVGVGKPGRVLGFLRIKCKKKINILFILCPARVSTAFCPIGETGRKKSLALRESLPDICTGKRFPYPGLKGNAVKIGDSSRCCEPRPLQSGRSFQETSLSFYQKTMGRLWKWGESEDLPLRQGILQPAENGPVKSNQDGKCAWGRKANLYFPSDLRVADRLL